MMSTMIAGPFLTDIDPQAAIKGSRDPLGIQPIWTRLGRHVVGNLTTVSSSVRDFGLGSSTASRASWKAVGWRQKRSKQLKSKKLTETPYLRSIKQLQWTAWTFLGQHWWMIYKLRVRSIQRRSVATGYACRSASSACFLFEICASNFALISRR